MIAAALALALPAGAATRRFAVVVGNDEGGPDTRPLVFAETDARKVHSLLVGPGLVRPDDASLLLAANRSNVLASLSSLRTRVAEAEAAGDRTLLVFFYSGHADERRLQLGRSSLSWEELDALLAQSGADVRMAFLDACRSGSMTREKGAARAPGFRVDLEERLSATGQVVIASSADDEASQESDEIGGGYFTHYLSSALAGAADDDTDGRVTLGEAYRYVYRETVFHTAGTRTGAQHPTYEWDLHGEGDLVLSDLGATSAALVFPTGLQGRYAVFDRDRRRFVAEVQAAGSERRLALPPGSYLVQERFPTHLEVVEVELKEGSTAAVDRASFAVVEYEDDVARGAIDRQVQRANLPALSVRLVFGGRGFSDDAFAAEYLPPTGMAGAVARWRWRDGRWFDLDVTGGTGTSVLTLDGLDYGVPVTVSSTTFGAAAGFATPQRLVQAGAGLRLAGAYFEREFPGQALEPQTLFGVAPGLVGWAGLHPGRFEVDLELRVHYLPYAVDDRESGTAFSEALIGLGYRF